MRINGDMLEWLAKETERVLRSKGIWAEVSVHLGRVHARVPRPGGGSFLYGLDVRDQLDLGDEGFAAENWAREIFDAECEAAKKAVR